MFPTGLRAATPFESTQSYSHVKKVNANFATYSIDVGGSADMDNSMTSFFDSIEITFQNNESLTIANTGDVSVHNPRVVANSRGRWWSMTSLLEEILEGAETDQEKALHIYEFVRKNRYHDDFVFSGDELHDPVRFFNEFGGGFCDDSGFVGCSLFYHAGLNKTNSSRDPRIRTLKGHMMVEAFVDSGFQFLDMDQQTYYLDLENDIPVGGDAVVQDHYLAVREQAFGPLFTSWTIGDRAAALFGRDDGAMFRAIAGHRIEYSLRPGERIIYRWDNVGKFPADDSQKTSSRKYWGNSLWVFEPGLTEKRLQEDAIKVSSEYFIYEMTTPYSVCGGRIQADFGESSIPDSFTIAVSLDTLNWKQVWSSGGEGKTRCDLKIDEYLEYKRAPPKNTYFVKVGADPTLVKGLKIETDLVVSPLSLPRLHIGKNEVVYSDETAGPHEITISHQWRESSSTTIPDPPALPVFPLPDSVVRATTIPFGWPAVEGSSLYHIQVSRREDMRMAFRPSFDVMVDSNGHHSPFAGLFNPDEKYFWRVRARNEKGVWGVWSPVWSFQWEGPRIPVGVSSKMEVGGITISWEPNPRGSSPVRFEIYGSNEKGFTPSKSPYELRGLGRQQANFLKSTTGHFLKVVSDTPNDPEWNFSFYRIVAVDENGVESGPSNLLELPHPYIYTKPVTTALVGQPYHYQARTLVSLGDLQQRYAEPYFAYWEREGYDFSLVEGPSWMSMDSASGEMTGTPSATDRGFFKVIILCRRTFPFEQEPEEFNAHYFQKDEERYQAEFPQTFLLEVK